MTEKRTRILRYGGLIRSGLEAPPLTGESLAPGMRVGLFGGSFDPPHPGHLHVAQTAMKRMRLHRLWWLVSPQNPLKSRDADDFDRRMAAVQSMACHPRMTVSNLETRLGTNRTYDVIRALKQRHPGVHFVWLMGADNLSSIHRWLQWRDLFELLPIAVMSRPQDPIRARLSPAARIYARSRIRELDAAALPLKPAPAWTYLTGPLHSHSSTELRAQRNS